MSHSRPNRFSVENFFFFGPIVKESVSEKSYYLFTFHIFETGEFSQMPYFHFGHKFVLF